MGSQPNTFSEAHNEREEESSYWTWEAMRHEYAEYVSALAEAEASEDEWETVDEADL